VKHAHQEDAITKLESKVKNHEERIIHLEKIQSSSESKSEIEPNYDDVMFNIKEREKRPARLLPLSLFQK